MLYDVIISGGGIVGLVLAGLLGKTGYRIALIEDRLPNNFQAEDDFELRVSAISRSSQQILHEVNAWQGIVERRLSPYRAMVVWDATGSGEIRFDANELEEPELGHIVENKVMQLALLDAVTGQENIDLLCPARLTGFSVTAKGVGVSLADGRTLESRLLVGADGAHSKVRSLANIGWQRVDYGQKGLVCVARTSSVHQATAWQRFMPGGPLAFLPLPDQKYCSIVWSLPADRADAMLHLEQAEFDQQLGKALDFRLGNVETVGKKAAFPLYGAHADNYVLERIALIGDAAHTIHPLAGQGVNLGISDAAELASQLQGLPETALGRLKTLRRYERARKGENQLTLKAMEGFGLLFGNQQPLLQFARNRGLELMNRLPLLKNSLARRAMGI
ncbi:MAG: UbiH/UbiF/VisC/COQ6 family ubiquinone biosynthesis hydroxylase [Thiolinea sp.]